MESHTSRPRRSRRWRSGVVAGGLAIGAMAGFGVGYATFAATRTDDLPRPQVQPVADVVSQPTNAAAATSAQDRLPNFVALVQRVKPAVVSITATLTPAAAKQAMAEQTRQSLPFPSGARHAAPGHHVVVEARGSGFIIAANGTIVTNNHVVEGAERVSVKLDDGKTLPAHVVGRDHRTDIAVLKIDAGRQLPYLQLGDSRGVQPGEWVLAMGNPFGLGGTVTHGIVSGLNRSIGKDSFDGFIQVDAPINRGNSGGPLFSQSGKVIGMDTAILSPSGGSIGIGFAIPSDLIRHVVAQLEQNGHVVRGYIGVRTEPLLGPLAKAMGVPPSSGALIASVLPHTPAERAGLKPGDIVRAVNGHAVTDPHQLERQVAGIQPGQQARLKLDRDGQPRSVSLQVAPMPEQTASNAPLSQHEEIDRLR